MAFVVTQKRGAGILAGLFFASQPMQVGATGWIGGRTDALSTLFLSIFLVCLVQYYRGEKRGWFVAALVAFLLGAFSKEQAVTILPVVPLSVFVFGTKRWRDAWVFSTPFLIGTAIYFWLWRSCIAMPHTSFLGFTETASLFFRTIGCYGFAALIPTRGELLTYTLRNHSGPIWLGIGILVAGSLGAIVGFLWKRKRELALIIIAGILVYLPVANILPTPSMVVAPYRTTESGFAIACLFSIAMWTAIASRKWMLAVPIVANFVAGLMVTLWGATIWMSSMGLFAKVFAVDPHFLIGTELLAQSLNSAGRSREAADDLNQNLSYVFGDKDWVQQLQRKHLGLLTMPVQDRLRELGGVPNVETLSSYVNTYAFSLARSNQLSDAREAARAGLVLWPQSPKLNYIYGLLVLRSDRPTALRCWEIAMKTDPTYSRCGAALGHERVKDRAYVAAIPLLKQALPEMGYGGQIWLDLADSQIAVGDVAGAKKSLEGAKTAMFAPNPAQLEARERKLEQQSATNAKG